MELKNLHWFKSYGQNKIDSEIMAISFVFSPDFCPKLNPFGILGTYRMGKHTELISNPTFDFYAPPLLHMKDSNTLARTANIKEIPRNILFDTKG